MPCFCFSIAISYKGANYLATAIDTSILFMNCPWGTKIQVAGPVNYASTDASEPCTQDVSDWAQKVANGMTTVQLSIAMAMTGPSYCTPSNNNNKISIPYQCQSAPAGKIQSTFELISILLL